MNSAADFNDNYADGNRTEAKVYTFYTCTNAAAVQDTGAVPIFETKSVMLDYEEINYDPLVSGDGSEYSYQSWWKCVAACCCYYCCRCRCVAACCCYYCCRCRCYYQPTNSPRLL